MNVSSVPHLRRCVQVVVSAAAACVLTVATAQSASAYVVQGSGTIWQGPTSVDGNSRGTASWNATAGSRTMAITVTGFKLGSKCLATYFDWKTNGGQHYDARVARTCASGFGAQGTIYGGASFIVGMQKFGVCFAAIDTNPHASCEDWPAALQGAENVNPVACNSSTRFFLRTAGGALNDICTGGDPKDP